MAADSKHPLRTWVHGCNGRMGVEIQKALEADFSGAFVFSGGSDIVFHDRAPNSRTPVTAESLGRVLSTGLDLVFDFSSDSGNTVLAEALRAFPTDSGLSVLIGTTGLSEEAKKCWKLLSDERNLRVLTAPNTSVGILAVSHAARILSRVCTPRGFDIEITETHHRAKKDAPSGTARFIAERIVDAIPGFHAVFGRQAVRTEREIGVHSIRGGGVAGEHDVRFLADHEEISLSHRAFSRSLFSRGALVMGCWLSRQPVGFYGLSDIDVEKL